MTAFKKINELGLKLGNIGYKDGKVILHFFEILN